MVLLDRLIREKKGGKVNIPHTAVKDCVSIYISQKPNKKLEKMLTSEIISTVTASSHFVMGGLRPPSQPIIARESTIHLCVSAVLK